MASPAAPSEAAAGQHAAAAEPGNDRIAEQAEGRPCDSAKSAKPIAAVAGVAPRTVVR